MTTGWISQVLTSISKPFKWWIVVAPWESGVRVRLGKTATELKPGPHFRIPFLDRVFIQSIRIRTITSSNQTISTLDNSVATISWGMEFAIIDIVKLYNSVTNPETTMRNIVESHIAEYVSRHNRCDVSPLVIQNKVNEQVGSFDSWGLGKLKCYITGFAFTRTYRLLSTEYHTGGGLFDIDHIDGCGEKK